MNVNRSATRKACKTQFISASSPFFYFDSFYTLWMSIVYMTMTTTTTKNPFTSTILNTLHIYTFQLYCMSCFVMRRLCDIRLKMPRHNAIILTLSNPTHTHTIAVSTGKRASKQANKHYITHLYIENAVATDFPFVSSNFFAVNAFRFATHTFFLLPLFLAPLYSYCTWY